MRTLTSLAAAAVPGPAWIGGGAFLLLARAERNRRMLPPLPRDRDELLQEMRR